jgi:hypothetical protein
MPNLRVEETTHAAEQRVLFSLVTRGSFRQVGEVGVVHVGHLGDVWHAATDLSNPDTLNFMDIK